MYLGRIVEAGPTEEVLAAPQHPYTQALLSVVPEIERLEPVVLDGRDPGPDRRSRRAAGSTRAARRWPTAGPRRPGSTTPAGRRRWRCCRPSEGHRAPATWSPRAEVSRREPADDGARAGCRPRCRGRCTSTPTTFAARARPGAVRRVVLRRPADRPRARPSRGRVAVVDVVGESVLVTSDDDGALHAAYNVCRHRGSQLFPVEPGAASRLRRGRARCAARTTPGPTRLDGRLLRAPHTELTDEERAAFALHPVASTVGRASSSSTSTPESAGPLAESVSAASSGGWRTTRWASWSPGQVLIYEVAANYKVVAENYNECYHCGPVHPELTRLVPTFGGGGADIDWDERRAAPRGRVDVHDERHHRPGAAAGARRGGADPAQGRAGAPEPDALLLGRPRRGVRAAAAGRRPDPDRVPAAVPPVRGRPTRASTPPTPATSGTWSTGRTGRSASRCSAGCRRGPTATAGSPDGGRQRRHPPLAAPAAAADD